MTYKPHWRPQADGDPQQWQNCGTDSEGMAVERDREGINPRLTTAPWVVPIVRQADGTGWISKLPTMSSAIRHWINVHIAAAATTAGTTHQWCIAAGKALYGVVLGYRWAATWALLNSYLVDGRGAMGSIHYGSILGTPESSSLSFTGRHRIFINERRWNATLSRYDYLVYDPLAGHNFSWQPQGPQWWPGWLLKKAMYAAMGDDTVEFSYTRDTEP